MGVFHDNADVWEELGCPLGDTVRASLEVHILSGWRRDTEELGGLQVTLGDAAVVAAAAAAANLFESLLGAAVQGQVAWLSNDVVNALQISVAAALAVWGHLLLS